MPKNCIPLNPIQNAKFMSSKAHRKQKLNGVFKSLIRIQFTFQVLWATRWLNRIRFENPAACDGLLWLKWHDYDHGSI